jgi:hypothetical protein
VATGALASYTSVTREYDVLFDSDSGRWKTLVHWSSGPSTWVDLSLQNEDCRFRDRGQWSPSADYSLDLSDDSVRIVRADPRLFGLITDPPSSTGDGFPDNCLWFAFKRPHSTEPAKDVLDGHSALRVSYQPSDRQTVVVWYLPEYDYNPGRIEMNVDSRFEVATTVAYARYANGDDGTQVWFPSRLTYTESDEGTTTYREVASITSAQFGTPLTSSDFSLESLPIRDGRRIRSNTGVAYLFDASMKSLRRVNTSDVLNADETAYVQTDMDSIGSSRTRWRSWLIALNACLASLLLVAVLARRSSWVQHFVSNITERSLR